MAEPLGGETRAERFDVLQKSANQLGGVAWLSLLFGIIAGSVAANGVDENGSAALTFALACGPFVIAASGFMIARGVMILAANGLFDR